MSVAESQLPLLASGLSGLAALLMVLGLGRITGARRRGVVSRLRDIEQQRRELLAAAPAMSATPQKQEGPVASAINRMAGKTNFAKKINDTLVAADVRVTIGEYFVFIALLMALSVLVGLWLHNALLPIVLLIVIGVVPNFWLTSRREKRIQKFNLQLPDAIGILANALRSGSNLARALAIAARETQVPMSTELNRVVFDLDLQMPIGLALDGLYQAIQSEDLGLLINALNLQLETGGNGVALLEGIQEIIRQRVRLGAEVKSLTSQQRFSGYVVSLMPVALIGLLMIINPNYLLRVFQTTVWCGWTMFTVAAVMIISGVIVIQKVIDVRV